MEMLSNNEPIRSVEWFMNTRFFPLIALCGTVASYGLVARAIEANPTQPANTSAVPASAAPPFSGRINEIVSLTKSGVDQSVVLAYIKNSPGPFEPSPDEIIKLRDMGISTPVLTAMLERGATVRDQAHAAAMAAAPSDNTSPAQAPVITETPPSTYTGSDATYATPPASTVTYIGGDYGYSSPYYYPTTYYYSGWYPSAFFYPFPCWFGGVFYAHGCFFPHGGFVHDGFHVHDGHGGGFHGDVHGGFHGGDIHGGFHGGATGGIHGGTTGGFHGGNGSSHASLGSRTFNPGFTSSPIHPGTHSFNSGFSAAPVGSTIRGNTVAGGGFRGGSVNSFRSAPAGGGFRGGTVGGGFHGGMGGGAVHMGGGGGGGVHMGGGGGGGFRGGGGGGHR
jgi:hypothetical protein